MHTNAHDIRIPIIYHYGLCNNRRDWTLVVDRCCMLLGAVNPRLWVGDNRTHIPNRECSRDEIEETRRCRTELYYKYYNLAIFFITIAGTVRFLAESKPQNLQYRCDKGSVPNNYCFT